MVDLEAAETAREGAVTIKTHADQARAMQRWASYSESVGIRGDVSLNFSTKGQRTKLVGAFAMALNEGRFSPRYHGTLAEETVRSTISYVGSTFRENGRPNPTRDEDGELRRLLSRQYRSFKNSDPNPKQQKAVPFSVITEVFKNKVKETQRATGHSR